MAALRAATAQHQNRHPLDVPAKISAWHLMAHGRRSRHRRETPSLPRFSDPRFSDQEAEIWHLGVDGWHGRLTTRLEASVLRRHLASAGLVFAGRYRYDSSVAGNE